jgi:hypothetical protein
MEKLKRIPVESSMISAVAYDEKGRTLFVEFADTGNIYAFDTCRKKCSKTCWKSNRRAGL